MKRHLIYILFLSLGICLLESCVGCRQSESEQTDMGSISVKGVNGETYNSYQECCAASDFSAAHDYLAKMQTAGMWEYYKAHEYVYRQEALFLMSQNSEEYKKRIIYLLKEEGDNNDIVSMLIDLAIEDDDEEFVKRLANQYTRGASKESLKKMIEYLFSKPNIMENKSFLLSLLTKLEESELLVDIALKSNDIDFICDNVDLIDLNEQNTVIQLAQLKNKRIDDLIIRSVLLNNGTIPNRPSIGRVNVGYSNGDDQFIKESESFRAAVNSLNNCCLKVMNIAITTGNLYLAQKAKSSLKSNINYQRWDNPDDNCYWYDVTLDNSVINDATTTYNEAVKSGAFKK